MKIQNLPGKLPELLKNVFSGSTAGTFLLCSIAIALLFTDSSAQVDKPSFFRDQETLQDSSQQFSDRIVQSKLPVVVDFWAPWCGPCRMINPVISKLEKAYRGRVTFIKVNIDYNRELASYLGVQGIPAVFIIKERAVQRMLVGVRPEADFRKAIEDVLAMGTAAKPKQDSVIKQDITKKPDPAVTKSGSAKKGNKRKKAVIQ
jgi:thioredoxin 1